MPNLINFNTIEKYYDVNLYFRNVERHYSNSDRLVYSLEDEYPLKHFVHSDYYDKKNYSDEELIDLVDIRRWVERQAVGDVFFKEHCIGYRHCWNLRDLNEKSSKFEAKYSAVTHNYLAFHFETEVDHKTFAFMYGEKATSKMLSYHPLYEEQEKKLKELERLWGDSYRYG